MVRLDFSLLLVVGLAVGCGPGSSGSDGGDASSSGEASSSGGDSVGEDSTSGGPTGGEDTTGGEVLDCDVMSGELAWSSQSASPLPTGVALDPSSDAGEFYVSYARNGCLSRHDADGTEQWSTSGVACDHVAVDGSGDIVLAGEDVTAGLGQARVVKLAPDGSEQWAWVRTTTAGHSAAQDVAIDGDGSVLVVGKDIDVDDVDWVAKLDASGAEQWVAELALPAIDSERSRIGVDGDGNVSVAHTGLDEVGANLVRVVRFDGAGAEQWSVDLPGEGIRLEALGVDATGRTVVGYYTFEFATTTATRTLVSLDATGGTAWSRTSEDTAIEYTQAIAFGPCDTIVVAGMGDPGPSTLGAERQLWISKLTSDGDPVWAQMIDGPLPEGDADDLIADIAVDALGHTIAVGYVTVDVIDDGSKFPSNVRERWIADFAR